jgi:hypothetical protein
MSVQAEEGMIGQQKFKIGKRSKVGSHSGQCSVAVVSRTPQESKE